MGSSNMSSGAEGSLVHIGKVHFENQDCWDLEIKCPNGNISLCPHKLAALFPNSTLCIEKIGNTYQIISCNIEDTSFKRNSSILYQILDCLIQFLLIMTLKQ